MILPVAYDLSTSPPTYDFVSFLLTAEIERLRVGAEKMRIRILPGPAGGFRRDNLPPFTIEERKQMLDQIVLPMAKLLPSCVGVVLETNGTEHCREYFGYGQRKYGFPFLFEAARKGVYPLHENNLPEPEPYITITLREASYWPTRNSNLAEWMKVAKALRSLGWRVVIVRDTQRAEESFGEFEIAADASRDILVRASLYGGAAMNLFINNGPAWLCLFMGAPCMIFKMTSPDAPCVNDEFLSQHGFKRGAAWPNLRPMQSVEWGQDDAQVILSAVERMFDQNVGERVAC